MTIIIIVMCKTSHGIHTYYIITDIVCIVITIVVLAMTATIVYIVTPIMT